VINDLLKSLNIDPLVLLLNAALFLILVIVLNQIFWKPMIKHLDVRKKEIAGAYTAVDEARAEMERLKAEYQQRLAAIEAEARGRIQDTVKDAQAQREAMIAEARGKAEQIMAEGQQSIAAQRHEALVEMRRSLDAVAAQTLGRATGADADDEQRKHIDEFISRQALRS